MFKISCIHPTCRPKLAKETRSKWLKLAKNPSKIEYITCYDSFVEEEIKQKIKKKDNLIEIYEPYSFGIVKKCNKAATFAKGDCIIVATDDTIPEKNWDEKVLNAADWSQEIVLNTSDGTELADERLYMVKTVILSKKRYKKLGYVLHPEFKHVYCDNFHTWISYRDGVVIHRKDIFFEHLHPSLGKSKVDDFYLKASTQEEYDNGSFTFHNLIKKNFDKKTEKNVYFKFLSEKDPFKKYIHAYVLITSGFDQNKLYINTEK
jgi:hypothetical protein